MKISIEFATDNAAFEDDAWQETARILDEIKTRIAFDGWLYDQPRWIRDLNGNKVGSWSVSS